MKDFFKFLAFTSVLFFTSCGAYFNQPMYQEPSRTGEFSKSTKPLLDLPEAAKKVEVAVYNFSDQTGQYKAVENGSTFSTAVTQGATTILIKALEDSGWFVPIERENLQNLSTERNIISNTKKEYIKNINPNEPPLPPLLYAGLLLEGGIISYDTNIITGGIGARYFGLGGSAKYRQDRITVYLRAVSTNNGEILKTIYVSKTILSQAVDANFFRFVKFQRLLEIETGVTQNEPVQLAVKDAVEKAVHDLIIEGIQDGYWSAKGINENEKIVANYIKEKEEDESTLLFDRLKSESPYNNTISLTNGASLYDGDYSGRKLGYMWRLGYEHKFTPHLQAEIAGGLFHLKYVRTSHYFGYGDLNAKFTILPNENLTPYVYAGAGIVTNIGENLDVNGIPIESFFPKVQIGAGIIYRLSNRIGIKFYGEQNILFNDKIDNLISGKRNDFYYNFGFGLNYNFSFTRGASSNQSLN